MPAGSSLLPPGLASSGNSGDTSLARSPAADMHEVVTLEGWSSSVPTGVAVFARDEVAIRRYGEDGNTILRWTELTGGGHFAAMEVPEVWAEEVAAFFGGLRR